MNYSIKFWVAMIIALAIVGVAWHSIWEIHYLKSFYPAVFSMQEAFYATLIEWVKFLLTTVPLVIGWLIFRDATKR
jgi:hypothetical protein